MNVTIDVARSDSVQRVIRRKILFAFNFDAPPATAEVSTVIQI